MRNFKQHGYGCRRSAIFAPIAEEGEMLGVLEVVSGVPNALNGVNATKLDDVMPYIVSAVQRSKIEEENLIDAIIQHECTTVHDSVLWRFQEEARRFIIDQLEGREPGFREISFEQVYPLYGQTDIKESSTARNEAIQRDLMIQLSGIRNVLSEALDLADAERFVPAADANGQVGMAGHLAGLISGIRWVSELIELAGGDDCFQELARSPDAK
mgnify:CR=1 FL=1